MHPGSVTADATELPYPDPWEGTRVTRHETLTKIRENMDELKELIETELVGTNCATLGDDGLPVEGAPPKTGSLEHLRALHHPSAKTVGFVRALLVLLGEDAGSLGSWTKCRTHLVFRDQRNPWRNIHERLSTFNVMQVEPIRIATAAELVRKYGAEVSARKEWLGVYLIYKWVILQLIIGKVGSRLSKFAEKPKRPRVEPGDLPPEPTEEELAAIAEAEAAAEEAAAEEAAAE